MPTLLAGEFQSPPRKDEPGCPARLLGDRDIVEVNAAKADPKCLHRRFLGGEAGRKACNRTPNALELCFSKKPPAQGGGALEREREAIDVNHVYAGCDPSVHGADGPAASAMSMKRCAGVDKLSLG